MGGNHVLLSMEEPVVLQITSSGPSGMTYVDPARDPLCPALMRARISSAISTASR